MTPDTVATLHFGIPIIRLTIDGFTARQAAIVDQILALRDADAGIHRSNQNGWHSANDLFRTTQPDLSWLIGRLYEESVLAIRGYEGERFHGDVPITECWANVHEAGGWNVPHVHLPNEWSGCFYVSVDKALADREPGSIDGDLLLINPLPGSPQVNRPPFINVTPADGRLLLFPSYLLHMVAPHGSPHPRISLAFNFRLRHRRRTD